MMDSLFRPALLTIVILGMSTWSTTLRAQEPSVQTETLTANGDREILQVGTKQSPPFAIKNPDGSWTGISIELWRHLAHELNLEFEFQELTLDEMLTKLEAGELDAAVAAISVTSDRHERVGFCHPHYSTGLGIAVNSREQTSPWVLVQRIVSSRLIKLVLAMICLVIVCGLLFWQFERKQNTAMFGGKRRQGIGMGVWWSTTLLLGHKGVVPASKMGRILATIAMITSIVILSILTGVITSVLTVQQLDSGIARVTDLHHVRVATVASSTSSDYLRQRRIFFREYNTPQEAIQSVDTDKADAVVYDAALLKYLASEEFSNRIDVLPVLFNVQEYAIALQADSKLRKPLNEELLRYRESDAWEELLYRYLGD
ncbi:putative ABC transporter extracellular-binding protein YckB precursor [Polystyrenella longa]|uniref:Putative ABC transporter extracellular-binding protein YckB n=1 Tax=Polystyrenella longa TaxID=2528007 RepID=A0A518CMU6_9PLAN|nr:transporter substrate-binding domain-containing protein [Polystyrenella longa]QDU80524.1 putative ABC transporter extracellular-binding protein YckB precursor [Polystyrenella longa]